MGGGFTGIEVAAELIGRLTRLARKAGAEEPARVILVDRGVIASSLGAAPRPTILKALAALGVECRDAVEIDRIEEDAVVLAVPPRGSERIPCRTVVAATGMRASRLTLDSAATSTASAGCRSIATCASPVTPPASPAMSPERWSIRRTRR